MSEKTLKLKKIYVYSIYNNLRNTPSKEYSTEEILETLKLLPKLKEQVQGYVDLALKIDDVHKEYQPKLKGLTEEETKKVALEKKTKIDGISGQLADYNSEHAEEPCELVLEESTLKSLKSQFERWGNKWVVNIEEFGEIFAAFEAAGK